MKGYLDVHWDHRHNTHTRFGRPLCCLSKRAPQHIKQLHNIQQQFRNTVRHASNKTNRSIYRETQNKQGYNITLTTLQVQETITLCKNNNLQGPDKLNIRHIKHIGTLGLTLPTCMFKTALNYNIISHTWKLANIVHIPKPIKIQARSPHTCPSASSQ